MFSATILRPLTSARNYATIADPKKQIREGWKKKTMKESHARRKSGSRSQSGSAGTAPRRRAFVAVNFALQAACFRSPPVLLRYVSSSQKIFALQIFFGSPVLLSFSCCSCCLFFRCVLGCGARQRAALVYAKHTPRCQIKYDCFFVSQNTYIICKHLYSILYHYVIRQHLSQL